jgi:hypothetical protein
MPAEGRESEEATELLGVGVVNRQRAVGQDAGPWGIPALAHAEHLLAGRVQPANPDGLTCRIHEPELPDTGLRRESGLLRAIELFTRRREDFAMRPGAPYTLSLRIPDRALLTNRISG